MYLLQAWQTQLVPVLAMPLFVLIFRIPGHAGTGVVVPDEQEEEVLAELKRVIHLQRLQPFDHIIFVDFHLQHLIAEQQLKKGTENISKLQVTNNK